jgi:regulatory protein
MLKGMSHLSLVHEATSPGGAIRRAAMDLLAQREYTRKELGRKLLRLFSSDPVLIEAELEKLRDEGLQSDARLAEALIRSRVNRGQGPVKIKAELRGKGLSDGEIERAFEMGKFDWFALIIEVSRKRFGEAPPSSAREKAKRSRFLLQRGFNFEHISSLGQSE